MKIKIYINQESVQTIIAKKNKDLQWFASEVGVSNQNVSEWLSHNHCPSPESRDRIQSALGKNHKWEEIFVIEKVTCTSSGECVEYEK